MCMTFGADEAARRRGSRFSRQLSLLQYSKNLKKKKNIHLVRLEQVQDAYITPHSGTPEYIKSGGLKGTPSYFYFTPENPCDCPIARITLA